MADNNPLSGANAGQQSFRQKTAFPTPAQQKSTPAPTSRQGTASPDSAQEGAASTAASNQPSGNAATQAPAQARDEDLPEHDYIEADDIDSAYAGSSQGSSRGASSISSSVLRGHYEHGRRYQSIRENNYNMPSDEKQFRSMEAGHLMYTILEAQQKNPFFRSSISSTAQHILDLGTGTGAWANDVADMFPSITVHGVDLYPPPNEWVAPNCILEVDDFTKPWTWSHKFDLVHIRLLIGALPLSEWKRLYRRAYHNLQPGGWIEHVDVNPHIYSNYPNRPLPEGSLLGGFGQLILDCGKKAGSACDIADIMKEEIEDAGFVNVHEKTFQMPIGSWPKHPIYKDAGTLQMVQFKEGLEGWVLWSLTKFGSPEPWTPEQVQVYLAHLRNELDAGYPIFQNHTRVWAQKPHDAESKLKPQQPVLENVEPAEASRKD